MYMRLKGQMAERGITAKALAQRTGIKYQTLVVKLRGKTDLKLEEAKKIKDAIGTQMPIEELFSVEE